MASRPSVSSWKMHTNPFLQRSYVTFSKTEPRVRSALLTARKYGLFPLSSNPPFEACQKMPLFHHPAIIMGRLNHLECLQNSHNVPTVGDLSHPPSSTVPHCRDCTRNIGKLVARIGEAGWMPQLWAAAKPDRAVIWPEASSPYDLLRFLTNPYNAFIRTGLRLKGTVGIPTFPGTAFRPPLLLTRGSGMISSPDHVARYNVAPPNPRGDLVDVWTDGSAIDNGTESCTAGSGWVSSRGSKQKWRLTGLPVSNNAAEAVAVITAIARHTESPILIHTDSSFVMGLANGGLLALEQVGWPPVPCLCSSNPLISYRPLYQNLLSTLRYHGRVRFIKVKAHSGDIRNEMADHLANRGRLSGSELDLRLLLPLPGWVDTAPSLTNQSLKDITGHLVDRTFPPPASTDKFAHFTSIWESFQERNSSPIIPAAQCLSNIWRLPVHPGLAEILWKWSLAALPLGHRFFGGSDLGRYCRCGSELTLPHLWKSCKAYDLRPLMHRTDLAIQACIPIPEESSYMPIGIISASDANRLYWLPLLSAKRMEAIAFPDKLDRSLLDPSRGYRCELLGRMLWHIWRCRMKEIFDPGYRFLPERTLDLLQSALAAPPVSRSRKSSTRNCEEADTDV
jgi:ribonuclease HI